MTLRTELRIHRWIASGLIALSLLVGCGAVVRDSAEVRIVEAPDIEELESVFAPSPPLIRIGWNETGPTFERISGGAFLPDGGAAVVDGQAARLYLIGPTGSVESAGRRGEGPGETV